MEYNLPVSDSFIPVVSYNNFGYIYITKRNPL